MATNLAFEAGVATSKSCNINPNGEVIALIGWLPDRARELEPARFDKLKKRYRERGETIEVQTEKGHMYVTRNVKVCTVERLRLERGRFASDIEDCLGFVTTTH